MGQSKHDRVAGGIAKRQGTGYNQGPGADIQAKRCAIEVETPSTVADAARQLQGYGKPVYVAGTNKQAVQKAVQHYQNTTIGVMDPNGKVVKPSTRGSRKR